MKKKHMKNSNQDNLPRRSFLTKIWVGLGVFAGFNFVAMVGHFFLQGSRRTEDREIVNFMSVGKVDEILLNSVTSFRRGHFYLTRRDDGGFLAISLKCSHLGCAVRWDTDENKFICPCHSSSFDINGNVISSPAPRALDIYPVVIENKIVKVNTSQRIRRKKFKRVDVTYA